MRDQIKIPNYLALRLSDWHRSMYCPVYAVSSSGLAGRPVPRDVVEGALANLESAADDPDHEYRKDALEVALELKSLLGIDDDKELFEAIAHGIARTLWAMAWASEAERTGHRYAAGSQLLHVAPETPERATEAAREALRDVLKSYPSPWMPRVQPQDVEAFYNHFAAGSAELTPTDLGHELAMWISETGGEIDFEESGAVQPTVGCEYDDFADEWIPE